VRGEAYEVDEGNPLNGYEGVNARYTSAVKSHPFPQHSGAF